MNKMGRGVIVNMSETGEEEILTYFGTLPFEDQEAVVVLKESDLERLCKNAEEVMLTTAKIMPKELYSVENNKPCFVDELVFYALDETEHKLYLDRKMYSPNPKDSIWIRYISVDIGMIEDGEQKI